MAKNKQAKGTATETAVKATNLNEQVSYDHFQEFKEPVPFVPVNPLAHNRGGTLIETGLTFMGKKMVLISDGKSDEMAEREFKRISQVHEFKFKLIHNAFARAKQ